MRYFKEYRHKFTDAPGMVIDAGKKLLGYLANQKRLSGVDSLIQRIAVTDADNAVWIVEARFDKDISSVRIFPPGSDDAACELFVESGLLDLGPNIASDAGQRFNRGLPEFNDSPATLYFGDGVECVDGEPGLNGFVRVQKQNLTSGCLPSAGASVTSSLSDPVKKQAQALQPASNWSGLMHRYVQAVYGGNTLAYSATAITLTIGNATIPTADSVGLLNFDGALYFIAIVGEALALHAVVPATPCIQSVLQAWRAMPEGVSKSKLLTIAMSGCTIGSVVATGTIAASGNHHFSNRAAWVFAHDANKAVAVLEVDSVATAYEATFTFAGNVVSASLTTLASGDVLNAGQWPLLVADQSPYADAEAHGSGFGASPDVLLAGDTYDFPVYATYEGGTPVVVSCSVVASSEPIADASLCFDLENPYGPVIIGSDDSRRCRSNLVDTATVAYGFYATGWSTVSLNPCFLTDANEVVRSLQAGYQGVTIDDELKHDSFTTTADIRSRVPSGALNGPNTLGCAVNNLSTGTASEVVSNIDYGEPCVTLYQYDSTVDPLDVEATRPYFDASGVVFDGEAKAGGLQVLSLAWGANNCIVADQYTLDGGRGAFVSFVGASFWLFGIADTVHDYVSLSENKIRNTYTYNTPGDCGSGTTLTDSSPFVSTETTTLGAAEGDLVTGMWGFASPAYDDDRLRIAYNVPSNTPDSGTETAYPDPRIRGVELLACSVFMGANLNDASDSRDVSVALVDSEYEHPDGVTPFVADNDTAGDCEAFDYLGLQSLTDAHLVGNLADGDAKTFALESLAEPTWLVDGFAYQAAKSLLGACVVPTATINRGASLNMDRHTITGGYSPVSTPSFVGWA